MNPLIQNGLLGAGLGAGIGLIGSEEGHRAQSMLHGGVLGALGGTLVGTIGSAPTAKPLNLGDLARYSVGPGAFKPSVRGPLGPSDAPFGQRIAMTLRDCWAQGRGSAFDRFNVK